MFNFSIHFLILQKKEWLCLNCQTQRLMSGGLDDSSLNAPYPSPKHQVGSPRHQVLASQQPALQPTSQKVPTNQQDGSNAMPRQQKPPASDGMAPVATTVVKLSGDIKPLSQSSSTPTTTKSVSEAQKKDKPKLIDEPERVFSVTEDSKPTYKKGTSEPIVAITTKDEKRDSQRSRYYEVILHFRSLFIGSNFSESSNLKYA